ncbi:MAG: tetratricopeptide repeat protein [candidate division Zixibacteria bacterium]|nr:tetratricopeptide repeat protein [candidate division Zixibacteria bacterium]
MFPELTPHIEYPWVESLDTGDQLTNFPVDSVAFNYLVEGEPAFKAKRYEEARTFYQKAVAQDPQGYLGYLYLGDSYYFAGNAQEALKQYERAISLNPWDYRCYFYKANACRKSGLVKEARDAYRMALLLRPRYEPLLRTIEANQAFLQVKVKDIRFDPRVLVRLREETVEILVNAEEVWIS